MFRAIGHLTWIVKKTLRKWEVVPKVRHSLTCSVAGVLRDSFVLILLWVPSLALW